MSKVEQTIAWAIRTKAGWLTPYNTLDPDGPPKLYKTEAKAQARADQDWGYCQLEGGVVLRVIVVADGSYK
jgi:hypothetical protein